MRIVVIQEIVERSFSVGGKETKHRYPVWVAQLLEHNVSATGHPGGTPQEVVERIQNVLTAVDILKLEGKRKSGLRDLPVSPPVFEPLWQRSAPLATFAVGPDTFQVRIVR